jgi:hypothetical protein
MSQDESPRPTKRGRVVQEPITEEQLKTIVEPNLKRFVLYKTTKGTLNHTIKIGFTAIRKHPDLVEIIGTESGDFSKSEIKFASIEGSKYGTAYSTVKICENENAFTSLIYSILVKKKKTEDYWKGKLKLLNRATSILQIQAINVALNEHPEPENITDTSELITLGPDVISAHGLLPKEIHIHVDSDKDGTITKWTMNPKLPLKLKPSILYEHCLIPCIRDTPMYVVGGGVKLISSDETGDVEFVEFDKGSTLCRVMRDRETGLMDENVRDTFVSGISSRLRDGLAKYVKRSVIEGKTY